MRDWRTAWANLSYDVEHVYDLGDTLVVRFTGRAQGRSSGLEVARTSGSSYELSPSGIVRQAFYWDWKDCAAALGLPAR
jgi:hypothetical protein